MGRDRITSKKLDALCDRLNEMTGNPLSAYAKSEDGGRWEAQPGCYHIDGAYGGYALYQICNDAGGCSDTLSLGHVPARQLYDAIHSFMRGIRAGKELNR